MPPRGEIAWDESGSGDPVVFVHGITEDRHTWDHVTSLLAGDFRCVRLDLRGHGLSGEADDYSPLAMADDVATVVREASINEPPVLVGHSLGAVVVTVYAAQAPSRAVVNIDQPLRFGDFATALQPLADQLRGPQFHDVLTALTNGLGVDALDRDGRDYVDRLARAASQDVVLGVWSMVLDMKPDDLTAVAEQMLAAIRVPYLAVHGSDPGDDYRQWLARQLPQSTFEMWSGDGHFVHMVEPERFADRLRAFAASAR